MASYEVNERRNCEKRFWKNHLKIFSSYDAILTSNPSSPRNRRIFRHDVIDHDDTVFLPTTNSRRSSSRMSTESEETERRKLIRPKFRRCSEGVTSSSRHTTYGIVNRRVSPCRYRQKPKIYRNFPPASILAWKGQGVKILKNSYLWSEMAYFKFYFCFQYLKY